MQHRSLLLLLSSVLLTSCAAGGMGASRLAAPSTTRIPTADSVGAHRAADGFLAAFDSLQFDRFRDYFADDITMFFPFPQFPGRVDGKTRVAEIFGQFMAAQREARARAGRPMVQGIAARDLTVQMAGADAAVVSFHLGAAETPSRRSVVFRKQAGGWKVVHWHASSSPPAATR